MPERLDCFKRLINDLIRVRSLISFLPNRCTHYGIPFSQKNIGAQMRGKVQEVLDTATTTTRFFGGTTNKLELHDAVRSRTLDIADPHDALLIKFLDPITDPLELATNNLNQQFKVINTLNSNMRIAAALQTMGLGRFRDKKQLDREPWDNTIAKFQGGSLLSFMEIDPFYAEDVASHASLMDLNESATDVFFNRIIGEIKGNFTVRSITTATSNVTNGLLHGLQNGSALYAKYYADMVGISKELWSTKSLFGEDINKSFATKIHNEMTNAGLINAGTSSFDAKTSTNIGAVGRVLQGMSVLGGVVAGKGQRARADDWIRRGADLQTKYYRFGDDVSKVPVYLIHRAIGVEKAKAGDVERVSFESGRVGDQQYRDAVENYAIEYAKSVTQRLTFTWADAPEIVRGAIRGNKKIFRADFIMHPQQYAKVTINQQIMIKEQVQELQALRKEGKADTLYYQMLKANTASMAIGSAITLAAHIGSSGLTALGPAFGLVGYSITGALLMAFMSDAEEEEKPIEKRRSFSHKSGGAAANLLLANTYFGMPPDTPVQRDGYKIYTSNTSRQAMVHTFPAHPAARAQTFSEYMQTYGSRLVSPFFSGTGMDSSLYVTLLQDVLGEGPTKYTDYATGLRGVAQRLEKVLPYFVSGNVKLLLEQTVEGDNIPLGPVQLKLPPEERRKETVPALLGFRNRWVDTRDIVNRVGRAVKDVWGASSGSYGLLRTRLLSGNSGDYTGIMKQIVAEQQDAAAQLVFTRDNAAAFGFSKADIQKHLTVNSKGKPYGVSAKTAGKLMGKKVITEADIQSLIAKSTVASLTKLRKKTVGDEAYSEEQREVNIQNIDRALEFFKAP